MLKRLAKALIRQRVCAGWSEALLVAHTTLLEISCTCELTFCSFHRIEQNICLVGTSINKGCAVYYYSVVTHGLRIIRYLWTKCREKSVLRRFHRREQHTKFCIDSSKRSCRVDLHVVIAMWYTALYKITASFRQTKKRTFGVMWAGRQVLRQWEILRVK